MPAHRFVRLIAVLLTVVIGAVSVVVLRVSLLSQLDGADMLWLESPTNPMLEVAETAVLTEAAHAAGAVVVGAFGKVP